MNILCWNIHQGGKKPQALSELIYLKINTNRISFLSSKHYPSPSIASEYSNHYNFITISLLIRLTIWAETGSVGITVLSLYKTRLPTLDWLNQKFSTNHITRSTSSFVLIVQHKTQTKMFLGLILTTAYIMLNISYYFQGIFP